MGIVCGAMIKGLLLLREAFFTGSWGKEWLLYESYGKYFSVGV